MIFTKKVLLLIFGSLLIVGAVLGVLFGVAGVGSSENSSKSGSDKTPEETKLPSKCHSLKPGSVSFSELLINSGATADLLIENASWVSDSSFLAKGSAIHGTPYTYANCKDPVAVFCTETYFNVAGKQVTFTPYEIPVSEEGKYEVSLLFAKETNAGFLAAGKRVFDILLNGEVVEAGFDIFAAGQGANAIVTKYVEVKGNKTISIGFSSIVQNPRINAIRVEGVAALSIENFESTMEFGTVFIGSPESKTLVISNELDTPLKIEGIEIEGEGFHVDADFPLLVSKECGKLEIPIVANPSVAGKATGSLTIIAKNLPSRFSSIALSMTGMQRLKELYVNGGSADSVSMDGKTWESDVSYALGGAAYAVAGKTEIYASYRFWTVAAGDKGYDVLPFNGAGTYEVTLYFEESYGSVIRGETQRQFNAFVNGVAVDNPINIKSENNVDFRVTRTYEVTVGADEKIEIRFSHNDPVMNNPLCNGFKVIAQ